MDQIPLIQTTYVQKFIKSKVGNKIVISSNFKDSFQKTLSIFILYLMTISGDIAKDNKKSVVQLADLKKALIETGLDDIAQNIEKFSEQQIVQQRPEKQKKIQLQQEQIEQNIIEEQIEELDIDYLEIIESDDDIPQNYDILKDNHDIEQQ